MRYMFEQSNLTIQLHFQNSGDYFCVTSIQISQVKKDPLGCGARNSCCGSWVKSTIYPIFKLYILAHIVTLQQSLQKYYGRILRALTYILSILSIFSVVVWQKIVSYCLMINIRMKLISQSGEVCYLWGSVPRAPPRP